MKLSHLLLFTVAGVSAAMADEPLLTLDAAIARALERAPQMEMQRAALDSAQAMQTSAGRLPDPQLLFGVDNVPLSGPDAFSTTSDEMTMTKVGLMQSFPSGGQREGERERAAAEVTFARAQLGATRAAVARQTAIAWLRFASSREARLRLEALESDLRLGADAARSSLRAGRGSAADALEAEAAVASLKSRLLQLRGDEKRSEAELTRWIGADAIASPGPLPSLNELPKPVETLREYAHLHAEIAPLDARIAVAEADVELARAARRPGWGVELTYGKRGPGFVDMGMLEFTVDLPLFPGNRQSPVIAARSADLRRARAERDAEIAMHSAELNQMVISWQQLGEQLQFLEMEQLPLARERSRAALGAFRSGSTEARTIVAAFASETDLLLTRATLTVERGMAWSYLRYLQTEADFIGSAP
jgi:outer membrane protein TolC